MDGSVLSAPYDPLETRVHPPAASGPPATEIISPSVTPVERQTPLRSTIRAALPQVPPLAEEDLTRIASPSTGTTVWLRRLMAARGFCAVLIALILIARQSIQSTPSLDFLVSGLTPLFLLSAGAVFSGVIMIVCSLKAGLTKAVKWVAFSDGIISLVIGIVAFALALMPQTPTYYYWFVLGCVWATVTGACLIAIAIMLRRQIRLVLLLALSGAAFVAYGLPVFVREELLVSHESDELMEGFVALLVRSDYYLNLQMISLLISGVLMATFAFLLRPKTTSEWPTR